MESIQWSANRWWFGLALACGLAIAAGLFNMRQRLGLGPVDLTLIVTAASVFAGALASGLAGFAFSAVSGALLFHWLAPVQAVPLLLACSVATQFFSIARLWHLMQWRRCVPYLAGGLLGIPVGAAILQHVSPHVFAAGFGVILVCYSSYMLLRPAVAIGDGGHAVNALAGFAGGVTGGATAFPGAVPTILCNMRGVSKNEQRGIVQPFILVMQIATLLYFSRLNILASVGATSLLLCLPAVGAGTWLGLRLFDRVDDAKFRRLVLIFLLGSGALLVI